MMNEYTLDELRTKLNARGIRVRDMETADNGGVLFKVSDGDYSRMLKDHEFNGPALRDTLESIIGMARTWYMAIPGGYEIGFLGNIAEVHAAEKRTIKADRISHLRAMIPRLQSELNKLEGEDE